MLYKGESMSVKNLARDLRTDMDAEGIPLSLRAAEAAVNSVLDNIKNTVRRKGSETLRGFGTFKTVTRAPSRVTTAFLDNRVTHVTEREVVVLKTNPENWK